MYCWKKLLGFFKINIIVYNISYIFTAFENQVLLSFSKKASLLDRMLVVPGHLFGGVLISSPELDLRRYL